MISRGVGYMLLATFLFATMNVLVKVVDHLPAVEVVGFRSLISVVISYTLLRRQRVSPWGNNRGLLLARGAFGTLALVLYFQTLQAIPFASAVTFQFIAPAFATLFGIFVVKERVAPVQWLFFLLAFGGVVLVEGFDARVPPLYVAFGLIAAASSGMAQNIIRKLNTREHPLVIIIYFPMIALPLTALYTAFFDWVMPHGTDWLLLLGIGVLTQMAQFCMTKAIQQEALNKVVILRYLSIVYALSYGYLFFGETFEPLAWVGIALAVAGVLLNVWYKQRQGAQPA